MLLFISILTRMIHFKELLTVFQVKSTIKGDY